VVDIWKDQLRDDELLIDVGNQIVDLSNLVSPKGKSGQPVTTRKKTPANGIYPSLELFKQIPEISTSEIWRNSLTKKQQLFGSGDQQMMRRDPVSPRATQLKAPPNASSDPFVPGPGAFDVTPTKPTERKAFSDFMNEEPCPSPIASSTSSFDRSTHSSQSPLSIEIAPGVSAPLRGSTESYEAIQQGFSVTCSCFCCATNLVCIADADYVLCPDCRVVSPVCCDLKPPPSSCPRKGGVGLGLRVQPTRGCATACYY